MYNTLFLTTREQY